MTREELIKIIEETNNMQERLRRLPKNSYAHPAPMLIEVLDDTATALLMITTSFLLHQAPDDKDSTH